ncbi:MAG TPA: hypothetical protein VGE74_18920 [Gemmata sp.]
MLFRRLALVVVLIGIGTGSGCEKPKPPPPDGTSGVRGVALAPAEPADENGTVPPRQPWTQVRIDAMLVNSPDADYQTKVHTVVDAQGRFEFALNPGTYLIGAYDPERLRGKMLSPMLVKVEPGAFTQIVFDYDKLNVRDVPEGR